MLKATLQMCVSLSLCLYVGGGLFMGPKRPDLIPAVMVTLAIVYHAMILDERLPR